MTENVDNIDVIVGVLLDQYGHFIDSQINETDAPGDEGYIFTRLVKGEIGEQELVVLQEEDNDKVTVNLDLNFPIEKSLKAFPKGSSSDF